MQNNINMKKYLMLIIIILFVLLSCSKKKEKPFTYKIVEKQTILLEDVSVEYPSITEQIDNKLLDDIKQTYTLIKKKYDVIPTIKYQEYLGDKHVSYLIDYMYLDCYIEKCYIYHLEKGERVYFNFDNIISSLKEITKLNLSKTDEGFLKPIVKDDKIIVTMSKYLTGKADEKIELAFEDKYLTFAKKETPQLPLKVISLTFDDAPSPKTKELVDLLKSLEIKATFFILGCNLKYYKEELKYIYDHGHEIGNHSYSHPDFKKITVDKGIEEINKTQELIFDVINRYPRVFRFPYGSVNKEVLKQIDLATVLWSIDSMDWENYQTDVILSRVRSNLKNGGIILFHDFKYFNKEAITTIVKELQTEGYTFVTVSDLLSLNDINNFRLNKIYPKL